MGEGRLFKGYDALHYMALVGGIDEAGRGPVIGPMVMAIVLVDEKEEQKLAELGVKDSKLVLPAKREKLFHTITKAYPHKIIELSPREVDNALNTDSSNLNWLEAQTSARLINAFEMDKVIVDCPSNNVASYVAYLQELLKHPQLHIVAEHKADTTYPVCAAASILAKVTRDRKIAQLKKKHKVDFGSGYPSDPATKSFVQKHFDHPAFQEMFRRSWQSYKKLVNQKQQKTLKGF